MNTQKVLENGQNRFPLSTDTLDFMQNQTLLLQGLAKALGDNYIITQPTSLIDGLVVINGEILPLKYGSGTGSSYIYVSESKANITANGLTFTEARTTRFAQYTGTEGVSTEQYPKANFPLIRKPVYKPGTIGNTALTVIGNKLMDGAQSPNGFGLRGNVNADGFLVISGFIKPNMAAIGSVGVYDDVVVASLPANFPKPAYTVSGEVFVSRDIARQFQFVKVPGVFKLNTAGNITVEIASYEQDNNPATLWNYVTLTADLMRTVS